MLILNLLTPTRAIVEKLEVEEIHIPAFLGQAQILEGHSPLMSLMSPGILKYKESKKKHSVLVAISWGYCEVIGSEVNILAETAETAEDIDLSRLQQSREKSTKKLESAAITAVEISKYLEKIKRARVREQVAKFRE